MVQIQRLRLSGFKSFVDKTELDVGDGLNGIVGPNGCGKSNLVEALRWVMGENRAKNMRSGDMEDVIFAGTSARPARSIAEVSLLLDNSDGRAPHPFGGTAQIEVTRRIERDKGSKYLVNGKEVRARDVQMLFADALTGAHSPALVSQGRVTQLIQAKPTERRQMLEESAGVASLYTRRHEAELRLRAAEDNLTKLDLVINELGNRANSLRSQARAAEKYRSLSESIRKLESLIAWQDWGATRDKLRKEEQRHAETDNALREVMLKTSALTRAAAEAAENVEALRINDAEARAALQLLRQALDQLERESAHRRNEHADIIRQMAEAEADLRLAAEQRDALADRASVIAADLEKISSEDAENPVGLAPLEDELVVLQSAVRDCENAILAKQDEIRRVRTDRDAARVAAERADAEAQRLAQRLVEIQSQFEAAQVAGSEEAELDAVLAAIAEHKAARETAEAELQEKQAALEALRDEAQSAKTDMQTLEQDKSSKAREIKSFADLIAQLSKGYEGSYILGLEIPPAYATALSAAAGDAVLRATEGDWSVNGQRFAASEWPEGVTPLDSVIDAPEALKAFVSSIGIADADAAPALVALLQRGQVLVSADGQVWRWDGLHAVRASDTESRLMTLKADLKDAEAVFGTFDAKITEAKAAYEQKITARYAAQSICAELQGKIRSLQSEIQAGERRADALQKTVNDRVVRRSLLEGQCQQAHEAAEAARISAQSASEGYATLMDTEAEDALAQTLTYTEDALSEHRQKRDALTAQIEGIKAAALQAKQLTERLKNEAARTNDQIARFKAQAESLASRIEALGARKATLDPLVAEDEAGTARSAILERIADAETKAAHASDGFAEADARAKSTAQELKKAEEEGITLRERRAVIIATTDALKGEQERIAIDIQERFSCSPSALEGAVMSEWAENIPSQSKARAERDALNRDRDDMGPVNLRADVELTEAEAEAARLDNEKSDLTAAIERLREGIGMLNGEARERLVKTFEQVNTHFQHLFKRLFGGGEAYLKLIDSEDPLDAGLEIFAQPPGKALQSLSLLSGGEQTLTALSMIFAMFLANPAPVCVLDEVDAPLDDANVDRVCGLLEEMSNQCSTRFLIITHHRMTMARMDRLYGVTMAERGISQLVSVNLAAQGDLLEKLKAA